MDFKTIPGVPLVSTGTYSLGTGEATFTADDLAAAVLASKDPTVSKPRIKIGHIDKRFENDESLDGEPAMGTVENLTLSEDGQTIVGDLANVPAWLADSMPSAYPGRSVEGGFGFAAPSGKTYKFAISNLALLGTTWPGVSSLPDLQEVLSKNGQPNDVAAKSERTVMASVGSADEKLPAPTSTAASLDVGGIPRVFAADITGGRVPKSGDLDQSKWWARSVEASDDGQLSILVDTAAGKLLRLPITVAEKALNYGEPQLVAASTGALSADYKGPRVLASWPSNSTTPEVKRMKINAEVDPAKLRKGLGLAEDADEAAIEAALAGEAETTDPETSETTGTTSTETPELVAASGKLPEGIVAIDATTLAELKQKANAGASIAAKLGPLGEADRDASIKSAIEGGRIAASRREHFEQRWSSDPEGTKTLLTASVEKGGLAAVIPVGQIEAGRAGDGEGQTADVPRLLPELNTTQEAAA